MSQVVRKYCAREGSLFPQQVYDKVHDKLHDKVCNRVRDKVHNKVHFKVRDKVRDHKGAPGVIACRHGLHGLQFEAWSQISDMPSNIGNMGDSFSRNLVSIVMGENIFRKLVSFLGVKHIFRNLVPHVMGEKYVQEFGPNCYG